MMRLAELLRIKELRKKNRNCLKVWRCITGSFFLESTMKKVKIGNVELANPCVLAPMAGVTDLPFRLLCKEQGAGLLCMEMVSAKAIS